MSYSLYQSFRTYVTMIEHFRTIEEYRIGAKAIRNGLPKVSRGDIGFKDIMMVKHFVEQVMVEEEEMLEITCEGDAVATYEALSSESKNIIMINTDEISNKIFKK